MTCNYCDKYQSPHSGRSDRQYCSDTCRKAAQRFRRKLARMGIEPLNQAELDRATVTMDTAVFRRDLTVLDAISQGLIRIIPGS
jgi:hypothetical protein